MATAAASSDRHFKQYSVEQFLQITSLVGNAFSPDNTKLLVSGDQDGVYNAYTVSIRTQGLVQLTRSRAEGIVVQSYFPEDERFLYLADRGGDELDHLYVRELDGTSTDLTPGQRHKSSFLGWSQDGKSLFVATNERNRQYFDAYEVSVDGYERSLIFENDDGYELLAVSPDRKYLALGLKHTRSDSVILLYDRETDSLRPVGSSAGEVDRAFQAFSPDGASIYYTSNQDNEFAYLVKEEIETSRRQVVVKTPWDVIFAVVSHKGKYLVAGINKDARTEIRLIDATTLQPIDLPPMPDGNITSVRISRDETRMSFYASTGRTPSNLYVYDFSGANPRGLTRTLSPAIDEDDLVAPSVVRFTSYDGLAIPGLLYKPHGASPKAKVPALVWVHGGPGGQSRTRYDALLQYLVNHGYAVYAINNRGSSGYGKSFFEADDRRHGQADLDDCVASTAMLADAGYVDPSRIGIIGRSYGGYIALAALTFRPQEFAAGVDISGISNWVHTLENMPPWWGFMRKALFVEIGDPQQDRQYLEGISPLFHAQNIRRPLLVLQGANDPRVLRSESDAIVAAARERKVPVEYIVFDDEGHSIRKKENRIVAFRAIRDFLDRYLKSNVDYRTTEPSPIGSQ